MTMFPYKNIVRVHNIPRLKVDGFKTPRMTILVILFLISVIRTVTTMTYNIP